MVKTLKYIILYNIYQNENEIVVKTLKYIVALNDPNKI